jgi:hypothetical protein
LEVAPVLVDEGGIAYLKEPLSIVGVEQAGACLQVDEKASQLPVARPTPKNRRLRTQTSRCGDVDERWVAAPAIEHRSMGSGFFEMALDPYGVVAADCILKALDDLARRLEYTHDESVLGRIRRFDHASRPHPLGRLSTQRDRDWASRERAPGRERMQRTDADR